jgi:hypothetical protein
MSFAKNTPARANGREAARAIPMACTAVSAASRGRFSPIRRATRAVVPIESPMATA